MRLRNLSRWVLDENTAGLLFFAQRLDELVFDYSLDTYKPPALNSPFLCQEALELISEIERGSIEQSNLDPVLEELIWSVQRDPVAKRLMDAGIEYYTLRNEDTPLPVTKLRLQVLAHTINSGRYIGELAAQLKAAIAKSEKLKIDFLATTLVTSLLNDNVNKQWIHDRVHEYFFSPIGCVIDSPERIDDFLKLVVQDFHHFRVFCVVSNLIERVKDSLNSFGLKILDQPPLEMAGVLDANPLAPNEVLVEAGRITGRDPFSAREAAFRKLDNVSDLFTLFYHRKQISWRPEVLVMWDCCGFAPLVCRASKGPMEKAFDLGEERAAKELSGMLKNFSARRDPDTFRRFNRVVDLHGICVAHDIPENQLVNLWTALETLVPSHVGGSKIKQVVAGVLPFTGVNYIKRTMERLLYDLLIWDKWRARKILNKVVVPKGSSLLHRLAVLLVGPEYDALRKELYEKLGDFHLLRFRFYSLSKEFSTSNGVLTRLDLHEKKVRWQLRRFYRARNLIVHTSRSPTYVKTLIENGHDYLDSILFEVIRSSCSDYKTSTIEQVFEMAAISYKSLRHNIEEAADFSDGRGVVLI